MTRHPSAGDPLAAALLQITEHAERIGVIDQREAGHYRDITGRLRDLSAQLAGLGTRLDDAAGALARQGAILEALNGLDKQVAALAARLGGGAVRDDAGSPDGGGGNPDCDRDEAYQPIPAPRWWQLTGAERDKAIARLRAWAEQIYLPGYGRLAAALPLCWHQHPLCLYTLDWLSELWSVLYLTPDRTASTLAGQAEWQTRYLPAAADQMLTETSTCEHARRPPARAGSLQASEAPHGR